MSGCHSRQGNFNLKSVLSLTFQQKQYFLRISNIIGNVLKHQADQLSEQIYLIYSLKWTSQVALVVKNLPANGGDTRDVDSVPRLE